MNKRERLLVIIIGVLGVAFVARVGVMAYLDALGRARAAVTNAKQELKEAEAAKEAYDEHQKTWSDIGRQTLTQDAETIGNTLREDLLRISRDAGLQQIEIDPGAVRKPTERKPMGTAHPKVRAQGRLANIVKFLYLVQTQPYLVRCSKMILTPVEEKDPKTGIKTTTGVLNLSFDLETPILLKGGKLPPVKPDPANTLGPGRLAHAEVDPYLQQISPKLFAVWVPPPEKATIIDPPNNGQPYEGLVEIKFRSGARALKHIIRVGPEDSPPVVASQPANPQAPAESYRIPEPLTANETRYVRIDEEGEGGLTEGDVIKFTTRAQPPPGKAMAIAPPHQGEALAGRIQLKWRPGPHAAQHVVYWGRQNPPSQAATQPGAEYTIPEELEAGLTIFWRIDEVGAGGTTEGDVWSFTTKPPERQAVYADMTVGRILSWPGSQQVVLEKPGSNTPGKINTDDDIRVEVGDEFYRGVLVMVHPQGAVSAEELPNGRIQFYFHQVGLTVQQFQPLSPETQPRIYHELQQLWQKAEGISQQPG